MDFHKDSGILEMNLVDLEHCGFDYEEFVWELRTRGITDPDALNPIALIVNFAGGARVTPTTKQETIKKMEEANKKFRILISRLREMGVKIR